MNRSPGRRRAKSVAFHAVDLTRTDCGCVLAHFLHIRLFPPFVPPKKSIQSLWHPLQGGYELLLDLARQEGPRWELVRMAAIVSLAGAVHSPGLITTAAISKCAAFHQHYQSTPGCSRATRHRSGGVPCTQGGVPEARRGRVSACCRGFQRGPPSPAAAAASRGCLAAPMRCAPLLVNNDTYLTPARQFIGIDHKICRRLIARRSHPPLFTHFLLSLLLTVSSAIPLPAAGASYEGSSLLLPAAVGLSNLTKCAHEAVTWRTTWK